MTLGMVFWLLFILWVVLRIYVTHGSGEWRTSGDWLILAALLFVLGWSEFGFIVRG